MGHVDYSFTTIRESRTDYVISDDVLKEDILNEWREMPSAVVIDETAARIHFVIIDRLIAQIRPLGVLKIGAGEACKSLDSLTRIFNFLYESGIPKHGLVVAIGGGTICDVVSAAAQLFRRGIGLALLPTTLLGQIDAAIGGKNGLNFQNSKNLLGHFYHPQWVICDVNFLDTLKRREVIGGFAEAIKVFAVSDAAALSRYFGRHPPGLVAFSPEVRLELVASAVARKLSLLDSDPFENSSRRLLNYGHAFAHNFEEESGFLLTHGEAVLLGMTIENAIAAELCLATDGVQFVQEIINAYFTQNSLRYWIRSDKLSDLITKLKSARKSKMNIVCLRTAGEAEIIDDAATEIIISAWEKSVITVKRALTHMCTQA